MLSQVGTLLLLNLVITFTIPRISWTGHVGGLVVGALLGLLLAPRHAPTMGAMWRGDDGRPMAGSNDAVRIAAYLGVAAILAAGTWVAVGAIG